MLQNQSTSKAFSFFEISELEEKKSLLLGFVTFAPLMKNYTDLMMSEPIEYWENYRFFALRRNDELLAVGGLNSANGLNLYGVSDEACLQFFQDFKKNATQRITALRGGYQTLSLLAKHTELANNLSRLRLVRCFEKNSPISADSDLDIVRATSSASDMSRIEKWCKAYNKEMGVNYAPIPKPAVDEGRVFFAVKDGELVGYCYQSIPSNKRFWGGRLLVVPEQRGNGIGRLFLKEIAKIAADNGMSMHGHVEISNKSATNLVRSCGFQDLGIIVNASTDTL